MLPLLRSLADGGERSTQETLDALAEKLGLSEADVTQPMPSRKAPFFTNRVAWAKLHLKRAGLLDSPRRGLYRITERGLELLGNPPARLDLAYLTRFPEYVEFRSRSRTAAKVGKTIIGKNRCIDIFCVSEDSQKAFAIECKFQDSQGTVDEKIPYALDDLRLLPMAGCIAYAGHGFSDGVLHMLAASRHAAYCLPTVGQTDTALDTKELDHLLAVHFGWWDVLIEKKKPV